VVFIYNFIRVTIVRLYFFNPNSALDKYGIDLRLVINGWQKPL